jgi:glutamate-1-semialdehyde 2,1-aminomutase
MESNKLNIEIDRYLSNTKKSRILQEKASKYLPGGSTREAQYFDPYPIFIDYGKGHYIYDVDGNEYLDFVINATSLILGHSHPGIVERLKHQASKGTAFSGPVEDLINLSEVLCERIPSLDTVRFTNSGTEATLLAIRAARAFTKKNKIAKFEGGYHGAHESVAISVNPAVNDLTDDIDPVRGYIGQPEGILNDVVILPFNDLDVCESKLREYKDSLACVIMEPVISSFGYTPLDLDFLTGIRNITEELGILLVFDEVQSLRISSGGAQQHFGVIPDLTAMGKIIGGGLPVGAFGGREEIMSLYDQSEGKAVIPHSGTFNGNPMTLVAGLETMKHLTPDTYNSLNNLGETLRQKLRAVFSELEIPVIISGIGSLFGIHFRNEPIKDYRSTFESDKLMRRMFFTGLLNEGVLLQGQTAGALNVLTEENDIDNFVRLTREVLVRIK